MEKSVYASARLMPVEGRGVRIKSPAFSYQDQQAEAHMTVVERLQAGIDVIDRISQKKAASP
jgi:hypothetical protein